MFDPDFIFWTSIIGGGFAFIVVSGMALWQERKASQVINRRRDKIARRRAQTTHHVPACLRRARRTH